MHRVAAIQMCPSAHVDHNLAEASRLIQKAVEGGAALIVLPEMFAIAGFDQSDKLAVKECLGTGPIQDFLAFQAKKYHVWIIGGTIPLAADNALKIRAACLVYDAHGVRVARYDKIHLFDVSVSATETYSESTHTEPGNQVVVIDTPVGKVGLAVCYDLRFPELFRLMAKQGGAEIFVLPAAFTVKTGQAHWQVLLKARAIENLCYMIAPAQCGTHANGRSTYGHSLIIEPWGSILAIATTDLPQVVSATIDVDKLRALRAAMPVLTHQTLTITAPNH